MKLSVRLSVLLLVITFAAKAQTLKKDIVRLDLRTQLEYCKVHTLNTLTSIPNDGKSLPKSITAKSKDWNYTDYKDRTSGFWPGQLWYVYETSNDKKILAAAEKYSQYLLPLSNAKAGDSGLGLQIFTSFVNAYQLTGKKEYKQAVLRAADSLAVLFDAKAGIIKSSQHTTGIEDMMSLELLFWASQHGGNKELYSIAIKHAEATMQNHFRSDYTSYDIVEYDKETGQKLKGFTTHGYADESIWARGQAWAIYGFTMVYRETGKRKYLDFAHKITRVYLDRLPKDQIPYWDFNDTDAQAPKDASAAAITASALLELSTFTKDSKLKREYEEKAMKMITSLTQNYQSRYENNALLLHSTGNKPAGKEIDNSLIYADYYYMECLARLEKLMWVKRFF